MIYAEAAFFDGAHVQHIADYQERQRLARAKRRVLVGRLSADKFLHDYRRHYRPIVDLWHGAGPSTKETRMKSWRRRL